MGRRLHGARWQGQPCRCLRQLGKGPQSRGAVGVGERGRKALSAGSAAPENWIKTVDHAQDWQGLPGAAGSRIAAFALSRAEGEASFLSARVSRELRGRRAGPTPFVEPGVQAG